MLRKGHHGEPLGTASRCPLGPGACWARRTSPDAAFAEGAMFHHVLLILCVRLEGEAPQEPGGGRRDLGQVSGREGVAIAPMRKEDLDTDPSPFVKIDSKWGSK